MVVLDSTPCSVAVSVDAVSDFISRSRNSRIVVGDFVLVVRVVEVADDAACIRFFARSSIS